MIINDNIINTFYDEFKNNETTLLKEYFNKLDPLQVVAEAAKIGAYYSKQNVQYEHSDGHVSTTNDVIEANSHNIAINVLKQIANNTQGGSHVKH